MIHRDDAVRINSEVREFYKSGKKSGNKIYANNVPSDQYIPADPSSIAKLYEQSFDPYYQTWSTTMAAQKARRRNQNAPSSLGNRPQVTDDTYYDFGKRIYNGGKRSEFASGNCMEMAAVSAAIAIDEYHFALEWVYIVLLGQPGDHAFCMLSIRKPTWATPSDMTSGSSTTVAYVIDPWLNTVCPANDYWDQAQLRVAKWAREGKRIIWGGPSGSNLGWYNPGGSYAQSFGASPLTYILAAAYL